jgi:hypothetical protein
MCGLRPGHSGRVRKFLINLTAVLPLASVYDGSVGKKLSGKAIAITGRTKHEHSVPGREDIANTGASIGAPTRNTARATATPPAGGNANVSGGHRAVQRSIFDCE